MTLLTLVALGLHAHLTWATFVCLSVSVVFEDSLPLLPRENKQCLQPPQLLEAQLPGCTLCTQCAAAQQPNRSSSSVLEGGRHTDDTCHSKWDSCLFSVYVTCLCPPPPHLSSQEDSPAPSTLAQVFACFSSSPELLQPTKSTFFSCDQLLGKAKSPNSSLLPHPSKTSKSAISSSSENLLLIPLWKWRQALKMMSRKKLGNLPQLSKALWLEPDILLLHGWQELLPVGTGYWENL